VDGSIRHVEVRVRLDYDTDGRPLAALGAMILNPAVGASNGQRAGKNFNLWL
jgi:hypothetical protein